MKPYGWMLPPEVIGECALLVTANDEESTWQSGLWWVMPDDIRGTQNRDAKTSLSVAGRQAVRWLRLGHRGLAQNLCQQVDDGTLDAISAPRCGAVISPRRRVNEPVR
ncbi:Type-2 restriction enzyme NaeI (fragment) [uncultured Mycobacterium sp.]|uniref:Type-2 restriction enzyme NaeI n=1 Tax=uncultured Mycobacterium sp. TaxID=171292 RepID=A0A1Y5PJ91_9MYCO